MYRLLRLATIHFVTDRRRTDRGTDDSIMPIADRLKTDHQTGRNGQLIWIVCYLFIYLMVLQVFAPVPSVMFSTSTDAHQRQKYA